MRNGARTHLPPEDQRMKGGGYRVNRVMGGRAERARRGSTASMGKARDPRQVRHCMYSTRPDTALDLVCHAGCRCMYCVYLYRPLYVLESYFHTYFVPGEAWSDILSECIDTGWTSYPTSLLTVFPQGPLTPLGIKAEYKYQ